MNRYDAARQPERIVGHPTDASSLGLSSKDVVEDFLGVTRDVGDVIGTVDDALGIDQVTEPLGVICELMVGGTDDFVALARNLVGVRQQTVRELLRLGERQVVFDGVERRTKKYRVGGNKL